MVPGEFLESVCYVICEVVKSESQWDDLQINVEGVEGVSWGEAYRRNRGWYLSLGHVKQIVHSTPAALAWHRGPAQLLALEIVGLVTSIHTGELIVKYTVGQKIRIGRCRFKYSCLNAKDLG